MSVRRTIINGSQKVWMARVAYKGQRRSKVCTSKEEARDAEADLLRQLKAEAGQAEDAGHRPATLKALFEMYVTEAEVRAHRHREYRRLRLRGHRPHIGLHRAHSA
jgi:hypothetical protein